MSQLDYFKYELSNSKWNKTNKSLNILQTEGKLILIIGNNGSGKTLLLIFITSISDKPVLSNFKINHPNYKPLHKEVLLNLPDCHNVFIDEMYTWLESRTSMKELNKYLSNIIFQKRKRDLDIYGTVQMYSSVDIRARKQSDILIFAKHRKYRTDNFHYDVYYKFENAFASIDISYNQAKELFKMYDTNELVPIDNYKAVEFKIIEQDSERLLNKVIEISNTIKNQLNKITHKSIQTALLLNNIYIGYEKYVYLYLDNQINLNKFEITKNDN